MFDSTSNEGLVFLKTKINTNKCKLACFDLDGTLIKVKSGAKFATNINDWTPFSPTVKHILQTLAKDHIIVIFTNQSKYTSEFQMKVNNIMSFYEINDYACYIATSHNYYRKPHVNMFEQFLRDHCIVNYDVDNSFYCGDAAGRYNVKTNKNLDHSISDYYFAKNIGISFYTPEQFFINKYDVSIYDKKDIYYQNFELYLLDCVNINKSNLLNMFTQIESFLQINNPKMIIMIGPPSSGKSTLSKTIIHKYVDYQIQYINQDSQKTQMKKYMADAIANNKNILIDNLNYDGNKRNQLIQSAPGYNVMYIYFDISKQLAMHLNQYRVAITGCEEIPDIVYHMYYKNLSMIEIPAHIIIIKPEMYLYMLNTYKLIKSYIC